jgi:sulfur dioxygenase
MQIIQLFDSASSTYTYIVRDEANHEAIIIDPVDTQLQRDLAALQSQHLQLRYVLETHAHADHITSAAALIEHTGAQAATPEGCDIRPAALQLQHGDVLQFGGCSLRAMHTPGHTAGSMCFVCEGHVFTGDTLLIGGCGRTDFQSGSAQAMYHSITQVLWALPDATTVWPGHDYHGRTHSTIGYEKAHNARMTTATDHGAMVGTTNGTTTTTVTTASRTRSLQEFVDLMNDLNLPKPRRIDEAVPANQSLGQRHDAGAPHASTAADDKPRPVDASAGYSGDVSPLLAYDWLRAGQAVLVDIRTHAERAWVGFVPDVPGIEWKIWPGMALNADFDAQLQAAVPAGAKVVLMCRSGIRSIPAAQRAQALGYQAFNMLEGFEGDPDDQAHRNTLGGWRQRSLPWRQN